MERGWFKCELCGRECDNSVRAPESVPFEGSRWDGTCIPCFKSYCEMCDSLLGQPTPTPSFGWEASCPECGEHAFLNTETARTIVELHSKVNK